MKIHLERSGGFAGRTVRTDLDSDGLPAAQEKRLRQLVQESGFFDLPLELAATSPGADRFRYRLTVQSAGRTHTVEMDESAVPLSVRPLLDWLWRQRSAGGGQ